jgi:hypothetical protein
MNVRHNAVQNCFKKLCNYAHIRALDTHLDVFRVIDTNDGRRPDLLLPEEGTDGKPLALDFAFTNATNNSNIQQAKDRPGYALKEMEKKKNDKYSEGCQEIGHDFMPMCFEIHGTTSEDFEKLFAKIVKIAAENREAPYNVLYSYWRKKLSTVLQVYNAKCLITAGQRIHNHTELRDNVDVDELEIEEEYAHNAGTKTLRNIYRIDS